jgi:hypothetical protein
MVDVTKNGKPLKMVPGFGGSCDWHGADWMTKWYGTMQLVMNYTEFFYKAAEAALGTEKAHLLYMDAHIMQGKLTGEIFKRTAENRKLPLNCWTFTQLTYQSSQMMGETFCAYQRPDGVIIYRTINEPHARFYRGLIPSSTPEDCLRRCLAWWLPAFAEFNPDANLAFVQNVYEHGVCEFAVWDKDVTPEAPFNPEGGDADHKWKKWKMPQFVKGLSWGPYYLEKPYKRADTIVPPSVNFSLYSKKALSEIGW